MEGMCYTVCRLHDYSLDDHEEELEGVPHGDEDHQVIEGGRRELKGLDVELRAQELHLGRLLRLHLHVGVRRDVGILGVVGSILR